MASMGSSRVNVLERINVVLKLYRADKLLQASREVRAIQSFIEHNLDPEHSSPLDVEIAKKAANALKQMPFPRIISECSEVHTLRAALRNQEDWVLSYDGAETKVWYRKEKTSLSHSIRIEGQIRAPLLNIAALLYEADLYEKLFWYVISAKPLPGKRDPYTSSLLRRGAHIQVYAPWPLYQRDVAVYGFVTDGLDEDDCIVVSSRNIREGDPVDPPPEPSSSRIVRVDMHPSGFELTPTGPGVTRASFLYNVDPHLTFVPTALINWGARTICRWSLKTLETRARDLAKVSDTYVTRLATEPVYARIRSRLSEYWTARGISQEAIESAENRPLSETSQTSEHFDPDRIPDGPPQAVIRQLLGGQRDRRNTQERRNLSSLLFRR